MIYTLAQQLEPLAINFDVLHKKYSPMLSLVNELIGVIPNATPIMEIWPTGYTFPILEKIKSKRVIKALTTVLKDNLDPVKNELGIRVKYFN